MKKNRFEGLNEKQEMILKSYIKIRTAKKFEKMASQIIGKPELVKDWTYGGCEDTGYFGGGKCSMGHTLRYKHFAHNKQTGQDIIFGIKCVSDFFEITPEKIKMIQQGFVEVSKQVDEILEKLEIFKTFQIYDDQKKISFKLANISKQPKSIEEIDELIEAELPLPNSYEKEINEIWFKERSNRDFKDFLNSNPQIEELVIKAQILNGDVKFKQKHEEIGKRIEDFVKYLEKYKTISNKQINLFTKILSVDYEYVDNILEELRMVGKRFYIQNAQYNEINIIKSYIEQYEHWGLTQKRVDHIIKIHNRLKDIINKIKENELLNAEG